MFTGLVETIGVLRRRSGGAVARALFQADFDSWGSGSPDGALRPKPHLGPLSLGESINVNGACLTVDRIAPRGFECDMSSETLGRTTLGALPPGARVHLERATPLGGRMGGHVVLGHVDGVGRVVRREQAGDAIRLAVGASGELARFLAPKGSVAVDGVSLTLNEVWAPEDGGAAFDVMLVPHTLGRTLLGELAPGAAVNLEVDVLARYVARQLEVGGLAAGKQGGTEGGGDHDHDERLLAKLRAGGYW